jgi:hypothetical protein
MLVLGEQNFLGRKLTDERLVDWQNEKLADL